MRRFAVKFSLFLLPLCIVFALPTIFFIKTGELYSLANVIAEQKVGAKEYLFGPAYSNLTPDYKMGSTLARRPDILALGTSRVMQFRAEFFNPKFSFYNAGGAVVVPSDFNLFLDNIPVGQEPKLIIISVDQRMFAPAWLAQNHSTLVDTYPRESALTSFLRHGWRQAYTDYLSGKFTWRQALASYDGTIGINASIHHNGFRNDGSYYYGYFIDHPTEELKKDKEIKDIVAQIKEGTGSFDYGSTIPAQTISDFDQFLKQAATRHIKVIGFLPPYSEAIYEQISASGGRPAAVRAELAPELKKLFSQYQFDFFDASDAKSLGGSDAEFIDSVHGSERLYAQMLLAWAKQPSVLPAYIDQAKITALLAGTTSPLEVVATRIEK